MSVSSIEPASTTGPADALTELRTLQRDGATTERAREFFDSLPPATVAELVPSRFRGSEITTGHLFDGLLPASGWYGKRFTSADDVDPLLFQHHTPVFAADPIRLPPLNIAGHTPRVFVRGFKRALPVLRPLVGTSKPKARLRTVDYRGRQVAAMVYDHVAIIDLFKKVTDDTLFGLMDFRGQADPYFFVLDRDRP